jgi:adenylate cyclase class 2
MDRSFPGAIPILAPKHYYYRVHSRPRKPTRLETGQAVGPILGDKDAHTMKYEVEMKFAVADMGVLESRLGVLGGAAGEPQTETDAYFAHPARDFAKTDEALRIRRKGTANFITYKGPKLDAATKTRREIDLPLPPGEESAQNWIELLTSLGFTTVGEVRKSRRKAHVEWQRRRIEVSLDEVQGLGQFVELELVVDEPPTDEAFGPRPSGASSALDAARQCIASLAVELGLAGSERRSYLELLLATR